MRKAASLLLTNRTPHATLKNTTDIVRWSMDLRYQSASLRTQCRHHPTFRRRACRIRKTAFRCLLPAGSGTSSCAARLRPQEVVTDPASFRAIRANHQAQPVTQRW